MNRTYILQKDLPDIESGAEFSFNELTFLYDSVDPDKRSRYANMKYKIQIKPSIVENNKDWFQLKADPLAIYTEDDMKKCFNDSQQHPSDGNEEFITILDISAFDNYIENNKENFGLNKDSSPVLYTREDMCKCFYDAKLFCSSKEAEFLLDAAGFNYDKSLEKNIYTFNDYINHKRKIF